MRVLAFRHSPSDGLGLIAELLDAHGVESQCADLYAAPDGFYVPDADALILLGGSMSANDNRPFIAREMEHIRAAIQAHKPVLGICLGAQLIAKTLGASVYPNVKKEIGWAPVIFTGAARNDPLFRGHDSEVVFHWHGETFDLPEGAVLLATSPAYPNQAIRWKKKAYGVQFHVEISADLARQWSQVPDYKAALERVSGVGAAAKVVGDVSRAQGVLHSYARSMFENWLKACELV